MYTSRKKERKTKKVGSNVLYFTQEKTVHIQFKFVLYVTKIAKQESIKVK